MRRFLLAIFALAALASVSSANQSAQGWCEAGGQVVITSGLTSSTTVQASFPSCTVTVFVHGGGLATIYSDNNATPTPLANPFTAQVNGQWQFYSANGHYDVQLSGAGFPSPVTYSDIYLNDAGAGGILFGVYAAVPYSTAPVFNAATASIFSITITGNVTAPTVVAPVQNGQVIEINVCQDVFGGHTWAWPANFQNTSFFTIASTPTTCTPTTWFYNGTVWQPFAGSSSGSTAVLPPSLGGTGTGTPAAHGVAVGEGPSTAFNFILPSNNGQCLMSAPSNFATTDPSYQTCPTGSGGTSAGPLGTIQEAGASAGSFAVSPLVDIGGLGTVVMNSADNEFCGTNPYLDARCYARVMPKNTTPVLSGITATCTSGLNTITLSGLPTTALVNGDGVNILHCGANNSGTTPSAPTVTPGGAALGFNTKIVKPSASPTLGSTTYQYQAVGITRGRGTSLPSTATIITTGAASLGVQTATISAITVVNSTATVTTTAPHTLSAGYEINQAGITDVNGNGADGKLGGNYTVATVPDTTHYTFTVRQDTRNGGIASAIGGTVTWTNLNHITMTASGGYDYYAIYGNTAGSMALVCVTEPVNAALAGDQTYLACDDGGSLNANATTPEYLTSGVPVAATNDSLTTTITSGSPAGAPTTSLTHAANAGASGTNPIHYDAAPNLVTGATAAIAAGAPFYLPITTGNNVWFTDSYLTWPSGTKLIQGGIVQAADTWNGRNMSSWEGLPGVPCNKPQFSITCAPNVFMAGYPGFYGGATYLKRLTFNSNLTNNLGPVVLLDSPNDGQLVDLNFNGSGSNSELMEIGLELRGATGVNPFSNAYTNLSFNGGPNQVSNLTSAPFLYCNTCTTTVFDRISVGRRGIVLRAPASAGQYTFHWGYNQGGIGPWFRVGYADAGLADININLDNYTIDTSAMPLISSLLNASVTLSLTNTNSPSSASPGGSPPLTTGPIRFANENNSGLRGTGFGNGINACNWGALWDPPNNSSFSAISESLCNFGSQLNVTPNYSLFTSDINITPPTCAVASAGPPFTLAGTYTFTDAAVWFGGNLGTISPASASCTSNGSQQITVTMPTLPPAGSLGWAVFSNIGPAGASFPSTTTTTYLYTGNGGNSQTNNPSGGPAGLRNGQVWGDFFPNSPNNTANAMLSITAGKLTATPCVPSTAGDVCYWNGSQWTRFPGNSSGTQLFAESPSGVPSWVAQGAPFPPAGIPLSTGAAWGTSYSAVTGNLLGTGQSNTITTGVQDFSNVSEFRPKAGTTALIPATCSTPDIYFATDSQPGRNWYFCTAPNVWTQQVNTGDLGLNTYGSTHTLLATESWANFTATATATIPHALSLNRWVVFCTSTCGTLILAPDSGNITLNGAAPASTATVGTGLGVEVSCDGTNCFAYGLGGSGGGGSGTVSSGTVNGIAYYTAATTVGSATPPTAPNGVSSFWTSTPSGGVSQPPASALPGIVGRAVSGIAATDTILSTDCNPNRVEYVGSVAVAVTLPTAVTLGVPKCVFKLVNTTSPAQTVTITPTTWTINGNATLSLTFGQQLWVYVDPNSTTNWVADQTDLFGNVSGAAVPASAKLIGTNASSQLIAAALSNTHIYVGSAGNLPVDVAASGDVTLANTGAFTVTGVNGAVVPTSASLVGTNASKQLITATGHSVALPLLCADTSGSGSVQVCNTTPTFTPVAGDVIIYTTTTANSGASLTLNVNSLGAKPVAKWQNSTTLAASDVKANVDVLATYDGTNWELSTIGNAPSGGGGTPCTTTANSVQYNNAGAFGCMTEFTYASSTLSLSTTGKIDASSASVTAGLKIPSAAAAAPTATGIIAFDTTNNKFVYGNGTNTSTPTWITAAATTNVLPKFSGTQGLMVASTLTDNGTTVSTTEPFSTGSSPPTCTTGTAGAECFGEGTAPTAASSVDDLHADSTQHAMMVNNNNTGEMALSRVVCVNVSPVTVSTNTTSDQNLMSCTLSANLLNVTGRTLKISATGVYSTAAASTASISMKAKLCTVSGCGSGTVITPLSATTGATAALTASNLMAQLTGIIITQTAGASSAYEAQGSMAIDLSATATVSSSIYPATNTATVGTIDSTGQLFLQITGAFSAGSTSNSFTERQLVVEVLN